MMSEKELFKHVEEQRWCIIPPNEETTEWRVYATFDDEGGYQDEIAGGESLLEALEEAVKFVADDHAWRKGPPTPKSDSTRNECQHQNPNTQLNVIEEPTDAKPKKES